MANFTYVERDEDGRICTIPNYAVDYLQKMGVLLSFYSNYFGNDERLGPCYQPRYMYNDKTLKSEIKDSYLNLKDNGKAIFSFNHGVFKFRREISGIINIFWDKILSSSYENGFSLRYESAFTGIIVDLSVTQDMEGNIDIIFLANGNKGTYKISNHQPVVKQYPDVKEYINALEKNIDYNKYFRCCVGVTGKETDGNIEIEKRLLGLIIHDLRLSMKLDELIRNAPFKARERDKAMSEKTVTITDETIDDSDIGFTESLREKKR